MIKIMVTFENDDERSQAVAVASTIHDLLHEKDWCTGRSWQNDPPKSWVFTVTKSVLEDVQKLDENNQIMIAEILKQLKTACEKLDAIGKIIQDSKIAPQILQGILHTKKTGGE